MAYNDINAFRNDLRIIRATQDEDGMLSVFFTDTGRNGLDCSDVYGVTSSQVFYMIVDADDPADTFDYLNILKPVDVNGNVISQPDRAVRYMAKPPRKARKIRVFYSGPYAPGKTDIHFDTYIDADVVQIGRPGNPLDPANPDDPLPTPEPPKPVHTPWIITRAWRSIHGDLLAQVDVVPECGIVEMNGMHPGTAGRWWKVGAEGGAKDCGDGIYMLEIGYTYTLNAGPCRTLLLKDGHGNIERLDIDETVAPPGPSFTDRVGIPDTEDTPPDWRTPFETDWPAITYIHQGRLGYASSTQHPLTVWLSRTGDFESMAASTPPRADDAIEATIAAQSVDRIVWALSDRGGLALGLGNSEWVLTGSEDGPVTPTSIMFQRQTGNGSEPYLPAVATSSGIAYVQSGGEAVREFGYAFQSDSYRSEDLNIMARHMLSRNRVRAWAWQREPFGILWCATANGMVAGLTLMREQEVVAWHRHWFSGRVKDVAALDDDILLAVDRGADGVHLEKLAPFFAYEGYDERERNDPALAIHTDATCLIDYSIPAAPVLLKGGGTAADPPWDDVDVSHHTGGIQWWTDGIPAWPWRWEPDENDPDRVLVKAGTRRSGGIGFISTLTPTPPELDTQQGTSMGRLRKVNAVKCQVYRACPFTAHVGSSEAQRVDRNMTQRDPVFAPPAGAIAGSVTRGAGIWVPAGVTRPDGSAVRTGTAVTLRRVHHLNAGYAPGVEFWAVPLASGWRDGELLTFTFTGPEPATILAVIQTAEISQFPGGR